MARETCNRCRRPASICICAAIVPVANRTDITIVQHMRERHHPFNTARIANMALERCALLISWGGAMEDPKFPEGTALLYPGPGAVDLASLPLSEQPNHLVVLDGTWPQAKGMYRQNRWLQALRPVSLSPESPSTYQIRREPSAHCLSTVESIALALRYTEPDNTGISDLLKGFHALIQTQVQPEKTQTSRPRRALRSRVPLLEQLRDRWEDVVVVYAETTPPRGRVGDANLEVLQLAAFRPSTGQVFDRLIRARTLPNTCQLDRLEWTEDSLLSASSAEEVALAWADFRGPTDLLFSWSWATAEAALGTLGDAQRVQRLKSIYGNIRRNVGGRLDAIVVAEGLSPVRPGIRGRAGGRLGNAAALAEWMAQSCPEGD